MESSVSLVTVKKQLGDHYVDMLKYTTIRVCSICAENHRLIVCITNWWLHLCVHL